MEQWAEFFVAAAGAAAALAGLVIVAISVNVAQITKYPQLPGRAAASIASLMLVVAISQAQVLPMLIGGVLLMSGVAAGEYLVFLAIIAVLPLAVLDAWKLLSRFSGRSHRRAVS